MAELTPMMRQYMEMKERNPGCLLFFRLGDFYEMFAEDAKLASKELDLTLTTRDRGKDKEDQTPMCGVPFHSAESYIARLVAKGYKVAICEQMEDPALAKGLVKRDIIRVVTPGTVTESSMLDERKNNYFACAYGEAGAFGLCFCDISTGAFHAMVAENADRAVDELGCYQPSELLLGGRATDDEILCEALRTRIPCCVENGEPSLFDYDQAAALLLQQFGQDVEELGLGEARPVVQAAGALLLTLKKNQKTELPHVRTLEFSQSSRFLELDLTARRNLELTETMRAGEKRGSLLWVLDKTKTAMGGRLLRSWLEKPLMSPAQIKKRQDAVAELVDHTVAREELIHLLKDVTDLERVMARIATGTCTCRDFRQLSNGLSPLPGLAAALQPFESPLLRQVRESLPDLQPLKDEIDRAIVDDPPFTIREGGMIRPGYSEEIDQLRDIMSGGKDTMTAIEVREKERTGIKNLRVGYNRVFGYYIEVAKGQVSLVPADYIRKQTLTNGERYITPELKELEDTILNAKDRVVTLEYDLFLKLRTYLADHGAAVQAAANAAALADVLSSFAALAVDNDYCRPEVDFSNEIQIEGGRHPVVEQVLRGKMFVPNDTKLGTPDCQVAIITGPNMAGKSTYMRQVALIVLLAQMGSFVPAKSARIGVVDRLFTRIGASDDLAAGQSTFMVEMEEVAEILNRATPRSLLILDEIGRGTSTYDGMAIARAVLEFVADRKTLGAKTLFATHYHELTVLEETLEGVKNFNISVRKRGDEMIFLRKIVPGGADKSYGVEVAKLAGLPSKVVERARKILKELEQGQIPQTAAAPKAADEQVSILDLDALAIRDRLAKITVETLTPIEAMNVLYELRQMIR